MDTADSHTVGLKLPVFWADHPRVWLQQAEAQFAVRNVTADNTTYHYVVAALDQATALRVIDVLEDPPQHNKYDNLKRCLTDIFGLSRRQRADQLLDIGLHSLGDRRPSQAVHTIREHLPQMHARRHSSTTSHVYFWWLAGSRQNCRRTLASERTVGCCFHVKHRTKRSATRRPATTISSGESPAGYRDVCFYHQRFGDAARKCVQPCAFAGNNRAGRQ